MRNEAHTLLILIIISAFRFPALYYILGANISNNRRRRRISYSNICIYLWTSFDCYFAANMLRQSQRGY